MSAKTKEAVADRHILRLYKAVANYIEHAGGSVVVAGGVQIIQWPDDPVMKFTVGIPCTGRKPTFTRAQETNPKGKR